MVSKHFWNIVLGLLVGVSIASIFEREHLMKNARPDVAAKCARDSDWLARNSYTNCLRRNQ